MGYGASTKVMLFLTTVELIKNLLPQICDQNPEKPGLFTPGSRIPIVSKKEMRKKKPDYILVLIWHLEKKLSKMKWIILKMVEILFFIYQKFTL